MIAFKFGENDTNFEIFKNSGFDKILESFSSMCNINIARCPIYHLLNKRPMGHIAHMFHSINTFAHDKFG